MLAAACTSRSYSLKETAGSAISIGSKPLAGIARRTASKLKTVALAKHLAKEDVVVFEAREVAAAAQQKMLAQAPFEMPVETLHISIFIRTADIDGSRFQSEMCGNGEEVIGEPPLLSGSGELVSSRGGVVDLPNPRNPPQMLKGGLNAAAQREQRLAGAARRPLPVGVDEHTVAEKQLNRTCAK